MSRSEVVHYDSPPLLVDTAVPTTSGCVNVRYHEVQALRAVEIHVPCPPDLRFEATGSAAPSAAGWPDIQQEPSRVDSDDATLSHEMLPWGCHYRDIVPQTGNTWVAADLSADPQVARAMRMATELSAAEDGSQPIPTPTGRSQRTARSARRRRCCASARTTFSRSCGLLRLTRRSPLGARSGRGCCWSSTSPSTSVATSSCVSATSKSSPPSPTGRSASAAIGSAATTGTSRRLPSASPTTGK